MESILLVEPGELMDADEAADLLVLMGHLTEKELEELETHLMRQDGAIWPISACRTLQVIEFMQIIPPTQLIQ